MKTGIMVSAKLHMRTPLINVLWLLIPVVVLLASFIIACSNTDVTPSKDKTDVTPRIEETTLQADMFKAPDLSMSPLSTLALPTAKLESPPIDFPKLSFDFNTDISSVLPK